MDLPLAFSTSAEKRAGQKVVPHSGRKFGPENVKAHSAPSHFLAQICGQNVAPLFGPRSRKIFFQPKLG